MNAPMSTPPAGRARVTAIFVDASYLLIATSKLLYKEERRRGIRVKEPQLLIDSLAQRALAANPGQLLRLYWFDGTRNRILSPAHRELAAIERVKVRLGNVNMNGVQKGVDHLIRTEMEKLAANRAITDAVLVTGDEDLLPAVEAAQAYGVAVHLWGVEAELGSNQAPAMVWEADTTDLLDEEFLSPLFRFIEQVVTATPHPAEALEALTAGVATDVLPLPAVPVEDEQQVAVAATPNPAALAASMGVKGVPRPPRTSTSVRPTAPHPTAPHPTAPPTPVRLSSTPPRADGQPLYSTSTGQRGAYALPLALRELHDSGEFVARSWLHTRGEDNLVELLPDRPTLPRQTDRELFETAEKQLGYSLRSASDEERRVLRDGFWSVLEHHFRT
jgi:uncharacterized LabA/DUF88 family protein